MTDSVLDIRPLGFPWEAVDPFLFCVHHDDAYPEGNDALGPRASLAGRRLGQDFAGKDGWRMYHGSKVPGFPPHPHRGFETVTIVRRGHIDHSDSLGATARFGEGDVQWLTAGAGIVHAEMFPLLDDKGPNPVELFQIWLNLPPEDKLAPPHFAMLWSDGIPERTFVDAAGKKTAISAFAGALAIDGSEPAEAGAPSSPPPRSWAARADTDVAIWTIRLEPGARFSLPAPKNPEAVRTLYFFTGPELRIDDEKIDKPSAIVVTSERAIILEAGAGAVELLMLQGRPIGAPVVQHGPFVMNTQEEIQRAFSDYRSTQFGGWPWPSEEPVHERAAGRFANRPDGTREVPAEKAR